MHCETMHCEILLKCKIVLYFNILYMGWKSWLDAIYRKTKKVSYSQPSCIYLTLNSYLFDSKYSEIIYIIVIITIIIANHY